MSQNGNVNSLMSGLNPSFHSATTSIVSQKTSVNSQLHRLDYHRVLADETFGRRQYGDTKSVFETTELLEMTLIQLPVRDLLFAQRVCKTRNIRIDHSSKLRNGLFLQPAGELTIIAATLEEEDTSVNKALKRILYSMYAINAPSTAFAFRNPLFDILPWAVMGQMIAGELGESVLLPSWRYFEASWRRMLVTQPSSLSSVGSPFLETGTITIISKLKLVSYITLDMWKVWKSKTF